MLARTWACPSRREINDPAYVSVSMPHDQESDGYRPIDVRTAAQPPIRPVQPGADAPGVLGGDGPRGGDPLHAPHAVPGRLRRRADLDPRPDGHDPDRTGRRPGHLRGRRA